MKKIIVLLFLLCSIKGFCQEETLWQYYFSGLQGGDKLKLEKVSGKRDEAFGEDWQTTWVNLEKNSFVQIGEKEIKLEFYLKSGGGPNSFEILSLFSVIGYYGPEIHFICKDQNGVDCLLSYCVRKSNHLFHVYYPIRFAPKGTPNIYTFVIHND